MYLLKIKIEKLLQDDTTGRDVGFSLRLGAHSQTPDQGSAGCRKCRADTTRGTARLQCAESILAGRALAELGPFVAAQLLQALAIVGFAAQRTAACRFRLETARQRRHGVGRRRERWNGLNVASHPHAVFACSEPMGKSQS